MPSKYHFLKYRLFLLLILTALLCPALAVPAQAQDEEPLPQKRWEELQEELEYTEREYKKEKEEEEEPEEEIEESSETAGAEDSGGFLDGMKSYANFILIGIAIAIIAVLVVLILKNLQRGNVKVKTDLDSEILEEIEDNLEQADIYGFLRDALEAGNYKLAIRLYFLQILQLLVRLEIIVWKKDKTNALFQQEMMGHALYKDFRGVCLIFERVWYGDVTITKETWEETSPHFKAMMDQLLAIEAAQQEPEETAAVPPAPAQTSTTETAPQQGEEENGQ